MDPTTKIGNDFVDLRLVDSKTGKPIEQTEQPGYYQGFSTLAQQNFWDEATREKILERVYKVPPIRFFTEQEAVLLESVTSHLLPQDDRFTAKRILIVPWIDQRLHQGRTPGYRFAQMPPDGEAYRLGLKAIEQIATQSYRRSFLLLAWREQDELLKSLHDAKPKDGALQIWEVMPVDRFWALLMQDCVEVYYAHPWAWDEIGFGGPAYPRGYMRLEHGLPEPWEVEERRYDWQAPVASVSDPKGVDIAKQGENPPSGQGGTH